MKATCMRVIVCAAGLMLSFALLANSQLQQAQTLLQQSKTDAAMDIINTLLIDNPGNIEARFMKGLILTRQEKLTEAETVFVELTRDHPELPEPYNNLAVIYAAQGEFEQAKQALTKAINTHPSYATAHENLGDIYAKMASRAYNQALELDDGNASAREKLALIGGLFSSPAPPVADVQPAAAGTQIPVVSAGDLQPKPVIDSPSTDNRSQPPLSDSNIGETAAVSNNAIAPGIERRVLDWAAAWSAQDVDAYLAFYSTQFVPPDNLTLSAWQQQRRLRLIKPEFIDIKLSSIAINIMDEDSASVVFSQSYRSDSYQDKVNKTLLLHKQDDQWKILEEISI